MTRLALIALVSVAACSRQAAVQSASSSTSQTSALACAPFAGELPAGTSLATLAGTYDLKLVSGTGRTASGTMTIEAPAGASATGRATVPLDSVGATAPGDAGRVTALLWTKSASVPAITIRFGTPIPAGQIEGAFTAIQLTRLTATEFSGTWSSNNGLMPAREASGYVCGKRR